MENVGKRLGIIPYVILSSYPSLASLAYLIDYQMETSCLNPNMRRPERQI
jgi:hypothetical protein